MKTNDIRLTDLMRDVDCGAIQLPDFQRGWVWDDERIRSLILSVIRNYPVGAAMFLEYGNNNIQLQHRPIEGTKVNHQIKPGELILDGQQRLTSLYNALYSRNPVHTKTNKGKNVERYYYLNIMKALDPSADDEEIVISVPEDRIVTSDFGRNKILDLSTEDKEFDLHMFPLNKILNSSDEQNWQNKYYQYHNYESEIIKQFTKLFSDVINPTQQYQMPVISLDKSTPKEAVCKVFENVNTGGVPLTVFELVTAIYAVNSFNLRDDWETRRQKYLSDELMSVVTATDFLTALTLLSAFKRGGTVSCKKKDVLSLPFNEYKNNADDICDGFENAKKLLEEERIFSSNDLPYSSQMVPLAAICAVLKDKKIMHTSAVREKVKQWYWCGVFGELYGAASESRSANDFVQVTNWIANGGPLPKTITDFFFNPVRLLSLQSRQSAAYKGLMALVLKTPAKDFISGREMDIVAYTNEKIDIHHIFPKDYCVKQKIDKEKWNSVINKTPMSAKSNREIGGDSPSVYLKTLEKKGAISKIELDQNVESHLIDHSLLRSDNFDNFIIDRAKKLLDAIEKATGRTITGRDSTDVQNAFGGLLI